MIITSILTKELRQQFALDWHGVHGVSHWARVRENGLKLSNTTNARKDVIELFAFLHDSKRVNDGLDPNHGCRAAYYAASLRNKVFSIDNEGFELLQQACTGHSDGLMTADITVQTCWDADRLDLGRVGIRPEPNRLCTLAAKDSGMLEWAYARSCR